MASEVYIVSGVRTPIATAYKGSLGGVDAFQLAETVIKAAVDRSGIDPTAFEDMGFGESYQGGGNVGRNAAIRAGLINIPGVATQRWCASAMAGVHWIAANITAGMIDAGVAGGVESMTTAPQTNRNGEWWLSPANEPTELAPPLNMALTVGDNAARIAGVTREEADQWAYESHMAAVRAIDEGRFDNEIVPVTLPDGSLFTTDEHPRRNTSLEKLASLPVLNPQYDWATTTAGNASGLNDAAAAITLVSPEFAKAHGIKPRAIVRGWASVALPPEETGLTPEPALRKALEKAGLSPSDLQAVEINEAFASVSVAATRRLGIDRSIVNQNGSGCSLGHPIGCTGTRMIVTMLNELERLDAQFGAVAMCAAGGMGSATVIERV